MTLKAFENQAGIPAGLVRAVVRQVGGWAEFQDRAADVATYGASGGFGGFIYYSETCKFTAKNRAAIAEMAEAMAADCGNADAVELVAGFRCVDSTRADIARALYGGRGGDTTNAENALAWFALEEVSRAYVDATERAQ